MQQKSPVEIDLADIVSLLWNSKWLITLGTISVAIGSVFWALSLPNIYRSTALLVPNEQRSSSGLGSIQGQYGAIASLAGIDLGAGSGSQLQTGLAVLTSRKFLFEFIQQRDVLVPLIAADGWSINDRKVTIDDELYDVTQRQWVRDVKPPRTKVPSNLEAYEVFLESLSVVEDADNGMIRVSIESVSPDLAKQWVDWLISDLNQTIMRQDVNQAERAISYLQQQIKSTPVAELQAVLYRLIEDQTRTLMLARISDEYLFKTVDPATVAEKKSKPSRSLIVVLATFLGFCFFAFFVIVRAFGFSKNSAA